MEAGYKSIHYLVKKHEIINVANLHALNLVVLGSRKNETHLKRFRDSTDIGFWRIKRK